MLQLGKPTTSRRCGSQAGVEVTSLPGEVVVRDAGGGTITVIPADWRLFAAALQRGEFDD